MYTIDLVADNVTKKKLQEIFETIQAFHHKMHLDTEIYT